MTEYEHLMTMRKRNLLEMYNKHAEPYGHGVTEWDDSKEDLVDLIMSIGINAEGRQTILAMSTYYVMKTNLPYQDIVTMVKYIFPHSKITSTTVSKTAYDLRKTGQDVPDRGRVSILASDLDFTGGGTSGYDAAVANGIATIKANSPRYRV